MMYKPSPGKYGVQINEPLHTDGEQSPFEEESNENSSPDNRFAASTTLIFVFKIDGMTCVACQRTIESAMQTLYESKGLIQVSIALLTNKMRIEFKEKEYLKGDITPAQIIEEIEAVGFGAELLEMIENNQKVLMNQNNSGIFSDLELGEHGPDSQRQVVSELNVIKICTVVITGMTCAVCQNTIETHLKSVDGVQDCFVSLLTHKGEIAYRPKKIGIRDLINEIEALGFGAIFEPRRDKSDIRTILNETVRRQRRKFLLCLAIQSPIFVLMWVVPSSCPSFILMNHGVNGVPLFVMLIAVFSTIIQFVLGAPFYVNSYKSLRNKSANMDVLVMLGTTSAWLYAMILVFCGYSYEYRQDLNRYKGAVEAHAHMFEISSVLITIILLGKLLESISKKKTVDKLAQLASLKVTKANLVEPKKNEAISLNTLERTIEVDLLQVGDFIKVYPGQGVAVDGIVIFGKGICNEAMLTGESRPITKDIGASMYGGSTLIQGNIIVKVTKTAENSSINQIIKLVENAQNSKAPIQRLADKIAKYFVPIIILLSLVTWTIWFSYTYSKEGISHILLHGQTRFQFAFSFGISTLVIACPCALGLATPTAVMVGTGVAASYGILIKGADVLEKISSITTIVFDKTGTLTSGCPSVKDLISIKEHFKLAKALDDKDLLLFFTYLTEKNSEHPLAKAIVNKIQGLIPTKIEELSKKYTLLEFKNRDGEGVVANIIEVASGIINEVLCGNDKLISAYPVLFHDVELQRNVEMLEEEGNTVIQVIVNNVPQLIISLEESHIAKSESQAVVNYLRNVMKLRVAMITGDNQHAAYKVAKHLGINTDDVIYKAYPSDKKKTVEYFQARGEKVMFVGDGINDSPVLAQADVGVAINAGSDITVNAAGIILMKDNLYDVINAIRISKSSFRRIKINFCWAFVYNLILVPLAMGALYPINHFRFDPMYAGAAMALSSISVVISSLLLRFFKPIEGLETIGNNQFRDEHSSDTKRGFNEMPDTSTHTESTAQGNNDSNNFNTN